MAKPLLEGEMPLADTSSQKVWGFREWSRWLLCCVHPNTTERDERGKLPEIEFEGYRARTVTEPEFADGLATKDPKEYKRRVLLLFLLSTMASEAAVLIVICAFLRAMYKTPRSFCYGDMTKSLPGSCVSVVLAWRSEISDPLVRCTWIAMLFIIFALATSAQIDVSEVKLRQFHGIPEFAAMRKYELKRAVRRHKGNLTIVLVMCIAAFGVEAMHTGKDKNYCVEPTPLSASHSAWHAASVEMVFAASAGGSWWSFRAELAPNDKICSRCDGMNDIGKIMTWTILFFEFLGIFSFSLFFSRIGHICEFYGKLYKFAIATARAMFFEFYALLFLLLGLLVRMHCDFREAAQLYKWLLYNQKKTRPSDPHDPYLITGVGLVCVILVAGFASNPGYLFFHPAESDWIRPCNAAVLHDILNPATSV